MLEFMKLFSDMEQIFEPFSDEERGRLLTAMMAYCFRGEEPDFSGPERYVWPVLRRHFDLCAEKQRAQEENGRKGGRPAKPENPTEPIETQQNPTKPNETQLNPTKPNETLQEQEHIQEQEQEQEQEQVQEQEQKERRARGTAKFEIFWKTYPKKVGKGAAEKIFERIRPNDDLFTTMLNAVSKAKNSAQWQKEGGQYIPNPATWLNQRRWEDESPDPARARAESYQRRDYEKADFEAMYTDVTAEIAAQKAAR